MNKVVLIFLVAFFSGTILVNGQTQNAVGFDGVDDYIDCGTDASLNITGDITVEAWIYLLSSYSGYNRIVEKDWSSSYFLGSGFAGNSLSFGMDPNNDVANLVETGAGAVPSFRWVHVAGTWDGSTLRLYVNGNLKASKAWVNGSVDGSSNSTKIGKFYGGGNFFNGFIDEVRIWSEARSIGQISEDMYRELIDPSSQPSLEAYYRFNEGSGQTSADLSANSNTAVFGGTTSVEPSDPTWGPSTCPLPYYTVNDGNWNDDLTWASGQKKPEKDWVRALIMNNVTANSNETSLEVTVSSIGTLTVASGNTFNVTGDFNIESNSSGTGSFIDQGSFSAGLSNVQRYFAEDDWHLISSPISNGLAGIFTGMYLQSYNESTAMWSDIVNVNIPLNIMQGYALWIPTATTLTKEFSGTLNTGSQSLGFTANNAFGWNLLGNPYPSSIDWDLVVPNANMNSAVYYLDAASGNYVSYVGGVGASRYIPPMQGFWISATGNGTLALNNNQRTHTGSNTYYKSDVDDLLVIKASGNGFEDNLYIRFNEEATDDFDGSLDAWKLIGEYNNALPQLFSYSNDQKLSIDTRPATNMIPAGFNSLSNGEFTLSLGDNNGFGSVYVEDLLTGTLTDLMSGDYTFNYNVGEEDARFVLHFAALSVDDNLAASAYKIWAYNGKIFIDSNEESNSEMFLYDLTGRLIKTSELNGGVNMITVDQTGNYIVKVAGEKGVVANKVFIK